MFGDKLLFTDLHAAFLFQGFFGGAPIAASVHGNGSNIGRPFSSQPFLHPAFAADETVACVHAIVFTGGGHCV